MSDMKQSKRLAKKLDTAERSWPETGFHFGRPEWARHHSLWFAAAIALVAALITALLLFTFQGAFAGNNINVEGRMMGQVAMTETELRQVIKEHEITAYWAGPESGCLYSLVVNDYNQAFIRYLPNGKGLEDASAKYRVVATYPQADAFSITKSAGNQANAISFINGDGAQVFYSKELSANVYIAFQDVPFEIEIFDPKDGLALSLATASKKIVRVQ